MKAYKVEILIIDHDNVGAAGIKHHLENQKFPNHCIDPHVKSTTEADIGEWSDEHPLNQNDTATAEYNRLFPK